MQAQMADQVILMLHAQLGLMVAFLPVPVLLVELVVLFLAAQGSRVVAVVMAGVAKAELAVVAQEDMRVLVG